MNSIWKVAMPVTAIVAGSIAFGFPPEPQPAPDKVVVAATAGGSFLGIGVSEIDSDRAKTLNLHEERGVEITRVEEDSPASRAGLKTGDVVLEYGGQRVEGTEQFVRLVHETPVGREVKVSINRGGSMQTVVAKTGARKLDASKTWAFRVGDTFPSEMPEIRMQDIPKAFMSWRSTMLGIEGEAVDSQLAQYFGVKEGVLVRSVLKGSAAEKAGLKAGDVITKVDTIAVSNSREITSALHAAGSKKPVVLTLTRERREMSINVNFDEEKQNGDISPTRPRAVHVHVAEK